MSCYLNVSFMMPLPITVRRRRIHVLQLQATADISLTNSSFMSLSDRIISSLGFPLTPEICSLA